MKKSLIALVLSLVLAIASVGACFAEETNFGFSTDAYSVAFAEVLTQLKGAEVTWSEPLTDENGMTYVESSSDALVPVRVYFDENGFVTRIYSSVEISLTSTDTNNLGQMFGYTIALCSGSVSYIELDGDLATWATANQEMSTELLSIVNYTEDEIMASLNAPVPHEKEVGGHLARTTLSADLANMSITYSFEYLP